MTRGETISVAWMVPLWCAASVIICCVTAAGAPLLDRTLALG